MVKEHNCTYPGRNYVSNKRYLVLEVRVISSDLDPASCDHTKEVVDTFLHVMITVFSLFGSEQAGEDKKREKNQC